jgi:hypothetical protein
MKIANIKFEFVCGCTFGGGCALYMVVTLIEYWLVNYHRTFNG